MNLARDKYLGRGQAQLIISRSIVYKACALSPCLIRPLRLSSFGLSGLKTKLRIKGSYRCLGKKPQKTFHLSRRYKGLFEVALRLFPTIASCGRCKLRQKRRQLFDLESLVFFYFIPRPETSLTVGNRRKQSQHLMSLLDHNFLILRWYSCSFTPQCICESSRYPDNKHEIGLAIFLFTARIGMLCAHQYFMSKTLLNSQE